MKVFLHSLTGIGPALVLALLLMTASLTAAEKAAGSLKYKSPKKSFAVALKHAYLLSGPDTFEKEKTIRRLVLSTADVSKAIAAADALNGLDGDFKEGIIVDLVDGPRFNYWVVLNNQLVQYSGTVDPSALKAKTDAADHLAGKLHFDDTKAGGAALDVEFDAPLAKAYTKAR